MTDETMQRQGWGGRIFQINVSQGGVPKLAVPQAEVRRPPGSEAPAPERAQAPGRLKSAPRQNFPPALRLKRRSEFRTVYDHGVRIAGDTLVLFVAGLRQRRARVSA